ncbi:hypothetical protein ACHAW6_009651 [Cyclotella cf. meneghiniana]
MHTSSIMALYHEEHTACDRTLREEKFSRVQMRFNMCHNHTIRCPVYALNNAIAAGGKFTKWSP